MKLLAILFMLLCTSLSVHSAEANGTALLKDCSAAVRSLDEGKLEDVQSVKNAAFCLGLVQGVVNTNQIYQAIAKDKSLFCIPPNGINNGQAARVVVKYLKNNPEELHRNESLLVVDALRNTFPCLPVQAVR